MATPKNIFCLMNCFNNYEIVGSKIVQYYIENAVSAMSPETPFNIQTYFETTPYGLYSLHLLPGEPIPSPRGYKRSKQTTDYITILGLTAVTLARIAQADIVVFAAQGVVTMPGFAVMYNIALEMNKKCVYWTDDLRNIWGTSDDPLFIGMSPLPYKYIWTAGETENQPKQFNSQPKGLNGPSVTPNLAKSENLCPVANKDKLKDSWNTFIDMIESATSIEAQNKAGSMSKRVQNLVQLGKDIIQYVEYGKAHVPGHPEYAKLGLGWSPIINTTLYGDIEAVIASRAPELLYKEEQDFIAFNCTSPEPIATQTVSSRLAAGAYHKLGSRNSQQVAQTLAKGMEKLIYRPL